MSKMPRPMEMKRYYTLLALAIGPQHAYGIGQQIIADSQQNFVPDLTTQKRIIDHFINLGFAEVEGVIEAGSSDVTVYSITEKGRQRLRQQSMLLRDVLKIATSRI